MLGNVSFIMERVERYLRKEQRREEVEETWATLQVQCSVEVDIQGQISSKESSTSESSSLELITQSTSETNTKRQVVVDAMYHELI